MSGGGTKAGRGEGEGFCAPVPSCRIARGGGSSVSSFEGKGTVENISLNSNRSGIGVVAALYQFISLHPTRKRMDVLDDDDSEIRLGRSLFAEFRDRFVDVEESLIWILFERGESVGGEDDRSIVQRCGDVVVRD